MRGLRAHFLAAAALGLSACNGPVSPTEPVAAGGDVVSRPVPALSAAEVRLFLRDSTLSHRGEARIWHVYLGEDGSMIGFSRDLETKATERTTGRWFVLEDGQFCREWSNDWGGGAFDCAAVYRYQNDYAFVPAGSGEETQLRRTRRPGNAENL